MTTPKKTPKNNNNQLHSLSLEEDKQQFPFLFQNVIQMSQDRSQINDLTSLLCATLQVRFEPPHGKTNNLPRRKQRRRSACAKDI